MIKSYQYITYINPNNKNASQLNRLFTDPTYAFNHCLHWGLLGDDTECDMCGTSYEIMNDSSLPEGARLYCPVCGIRKSIYHNTVFSHGKLKPEKVLHLLYCWCQQETPSRTRFETGLSLPTVINYFQAFRDACVEYTEFQPKIGGAGQIVEIDETQYVKRKNNQGRIMPNSDIWIFGGICRETGKIFATQVPDRTATTLLPIIQDNINDQTMIYSDCWSSYNGIPALPEGYSHRTVNHSQNFVDPITHAHTQHIERYWLTMKEMKRRYKGFPREEVDSHIAEAVWRHNEGVNDANTFYKAIELIRNTHFTHE